jgi:hypothetical protein
MDDKKILKLSTSNPQQWEALVQISVSIHPVDESGWGNTPHADAQWSADMPLIAVTAVNYSTMVTGIQQQAMVKLAEKLPEAIAAAKEAIEQEKQTTG